MFCTGECKKKNKRCGLLVDVMMGNDITGEQRMEEKCVLKGLFEGMARMEYANIRLQGSMDNVRNENVKGAREQNKTVAQGFLGLIHTINENAEAARKMKYLGDIIEAELEEEENVELLREE